MRQYKKEAEIMDTKRELWKAVTNSHTSLCNYTISTQHPQVE